MGPPFSPPAHIDLLTAFETAYGAQLIGCTVVRVRGLITFPGVLAADTVIYRSTLHIGTQQEAARATVAADNAFDAQSATQDYMMFEPFVGPTNTNGLDGHASQGRVIDVKSSRKLEELNQSLIYTVSARSLGANVGTTTSTFDFSVGLMLP